MRVLSLLLLSITSFLLTVASCQRPAQGTKTAALPSLRTLRFGSGGGITGSVTSYTLMADGRLSRRIAMPGDTTQSGEALPSAPLAQVEACFRRLDALPADSLQLGQPANYYTFIESRTATGQRVHLVWGRTDVAMPRQARLLYQELRALLPR